MPGDGWSKERDVEVDGEAVEGRRSGVVVVERRASVGLRRAGRHREGDEAEGSPPKPWRTLVVTIGNRGRAGGLCHRLLIEMPPPR